jgi:hypothetical protein
VDNAENFEHLAADKFSKTAFFKLFPDTTEPYTKEEAEYAMKYARALYDVGNYSGKNYILS